VTSTHAVNQWFPKWAVRNSRGRWSRNGRLGDDRRPS